MKKILSVLLTVLMALCVCTINIAAEGEEVVEVLSGLDSKPIKEEDPKAVENLKYSGKPQQLIVEGKPEKDFRYQLLDSEDAEIDPKDWVNEKGQIKKKIVGTDAGTYYVAYQKKKKQGPKLEEENPKPVVEWEDPVVLPVTIAAKKITIMPTAQSWNKDYGDDDPNFSFRINGLIGKDKDYEISGISVGREKGEDAGIYGVYVVANDLNIKYKGEDVTKNYCIESIRSEPFTIKKVEQPDVELANDVGHLNLDGKAEFFISNLDDFDDDVVFEITKEKDLSKATFEDVDYKVYTIDGYKYALITFDNESESVDYHIRAKEDKNHVAKSTTKAMHVTNDEFFYLKLSDLTYDEGKANGNANITFSIGLSFTEVSSNEAAPKNFVALTVGDDVLVEGKDFNVDIDIDYIDNAEISIFKIKLTDEYANSLKAGKYDFGFHLVSDSANKSGESFAPHSTITVNGGYTPSPKKPIRIVSTGVE